MDRNIKPNDTKVTIECGTETEVTDTFPDIKSFRINSAKDEIQDLHAYVKRTHKVKLLSFLISVIFVDIILHFVVGTISFPSAKGNPNVDPYLEEILAERIISSTDFRAAVNETIFCITCPYMIDNESVLYRNENDKCCFRDISSVQKNLKQLLRSKTDNLKDRVRELEVLRDNLEVIGKATNNSEHVTVVQKTSRVSNELLQELFSRKKSAIHLRDAGDYKKDGHAYHIIWSNMDTTKRNLDVLDNGSTVSISADGFYFLYCKILFSKYRSADDTDNLLEPIIYQIRRKRHGTAFLLEETRQKWEQVEETMEYQSTAQMVYKLDAGDMIYVSFPGNQFQSFSHFDHASHTLGLFEL